MLFCFRDMCAVEKSRIHECHKFCKYFNTIPWIIQRIFFQSKPSLRQIAAVLPHGATACITESMAFIMYIWNNFKVMFFISAVS